jgi:hypothetical protein
MLNDEVKAKVITSLAKPALDLSRQDMNFDA